MPTKFYAPSIISSECVQDKTGYRGSVCFKDNTYIKFNVENVVISLAEGEIQVIIEPAEGISSRPFNYHLKANSDSNKEAMARQLKLAYPEFILAWVLVVNEITTAFIRALNEHKQAFLLSEVEEETKGWLFEPFVQQHSINVLFGMGSSGKTLISLFFAILYAHGKNIWGQENGKGKTLLVDFENDKTEWRDKIVAILGKYPMELEEANQNFQYWQSEQVPLYNQVEKLRKHILENNISLVIVDSASMAAGDSTSDEAAALKLMGGLKMLDTSVLLIAHQRKNEGEDNPIGSIQYFNQARNIWHVKGECDVIDDRIFHISCKHTKCNNGFKRKDPIGFKAFFGEGIVDIHMEDATTYFQQDFSVSSQILQELKTGGKTTKQIAENINKKYDTVRTTLNRLKDKNKVHKFNEIWTLVAP